MISSSELAKLVTQGLISVEQSQAIQQFQKGNKTTGGGFSHSIMTIGALLIGLGILSLVALNWDGMSDIFKIITLLSTMTITYLIGRYCKEKQKYLFGGTLLFLSGLICGASIFLIAQIYNLTVSNDILLGIWILMILPLVYILRQKEFYWLYMILLSCVLRQFLMSHVFQAVDDRTMFVLYMMFGLFMVFVGLMHDYRYDDKQLAKLYKVFGANISLISYGIFIAMSDSLYNNFLYGETSTFFLSPGLIWVMIAVGLCYLFAYLWKRNTKFLWGFGVFFLLFFGVETADLYLLNYIIFITICIVLIFLGHQSHNTTIVKTANVYLYVFLLYLYGKYGWQYENKAVFFIIGGILMIGLGLGFSRLNAFIGKTLPANNTTND